MVGDSSRLGSGGSTGASAVGAAAVGTPEESAPPPGPLLAPPHLLRMILDTAPIAVWALDAQGRVLYMDGRALEALGGALEGSVGRHLTDYFPGNEALAAIVRRGISGEAFTFEVEEGGRHWRAQYTPIKDSAGRLRAALGVAVNVTEQVLAQRRDRAAHERLELIFRATADNIWDWDIGTGRVHRSNPRSVVGVAARPRAGGAGGAPEAHIDDWKASLHPEDAPRVLAALDAHLTRRTPYDVEYRILGEDGRYRWMHGRGQAVWDASGKPVRMVGAMTDVDDRRTAEEALRRSEEAHRTVLEATRTGYVVLDAHGRVADANAEYVRLTGREGLGAVVGRSPADWTAPHDAQRHAHELKAAMASGRATKLDVDYARPDGSVVPVEVNARVVGEGAARRTIALCRDVTEERRTAAALAQLTRRQALIFRHSPLGLIEWNLDFTVREWNPAAEQIFGWTRAEAIGAHGRLILVPELIPEISRIWDALSHARGGERSRNENMTRDGRRVLCEWYNAPIVGEGGEVLGVASLVQDVTRQARDQAELARREAELRLVASAVPALIAFVDKHGRYQYANDVYRSWLGLDPAAMRGRTVAEVYGQRTYDELAPSINAVLAGSTVRLSRTFTRIDGARRELDATFVPQFEAGGGGGVEGYCVLGVDATDRNQAERELALYRDRLETLVEERTAQLEASGERLRRAERLAALGTLAAGLGHDINNMLLPIRCGVDALAGALRKANGAGEEGAAPIRHALDMLAQLSTDLLTLASTPDDASLTPPPLDLAEWWAQSATVVSAAVPSSIAMVVSIPRGLPKVAVGPAQLSRAVLNLLHNAADALADRGSPNPVMPLSPARITLTARAAGEGRVVVIVDDNGPGMDEEVLRHAPEPFFTTKRRTLSTGLGLALVHGVAQAAGGSVDIRSAPGRGTTVTLTLPAAGGAVGGGSARGTAPAPAREKALAAGVPERAPAAAAKVETRVAHLTVGDERLSAFLEAFLTARGLRVVRGHPRGLPEEQVWVTDREKPHLRAAQRMREHLLDRVVLVLGPPDVAWDNLAVRFVENPTNLEGLAWALDR
jgi:PAS domain S-box-containing protein